VHDSELEKALAVLSIQPPVNREQLEKTRRELLATWHPHRYANLTNNPKRYMQMYKKGESMTKEIQKAYELVVAWLDSQQNER
jgi:DnaJ-domain-containing protein 1